MHTFHWEHPDPKPEFNDPTSVTIHHNGDYSGQAKVNVCFCPANQMCARIVELPPEEQTKCFEVEIPAQALLAFASEGTRSMIISAIEDIDLQWGWMVREESPPAQILEAVKELP